MLVQPPWLWHIAVKSAHDAECIVCTAGDGMHVCQSGKTAIVEREDVLNMKFSWPQHFLVSSTWKIYWYCILCSVECENTLSMFEGYTPLPPYQKHLINIVVFYPIWSAALMPWQIYSITQSQEKDKTTCSLLLFVTVMDNMFRERKTETELEGRKSSFSLQGNNTVIVCNIHCCCYVVVSSLFKV